MIYKSPLPDIAVPEMSITEFALRCAHDYSDKIAAIDGLSGRQYSYQEIADGVKLVAGAFAQRSIGPGSVVAIMAPNIPEFIGFFHSVLYCGAAVTTINPLYKPGEIRTQLKETNAEILVTISVFIEAAQEAVEGTNVKEIITIDPVEGYTWTLDLLDATPLENQVSVAADATAVIPFSSGTSGLPKGVELTHRNLVANLEQLDQPLELKDSDVLLAVLPFFHIYGMQVLMNAVLSRGASLVTMVRFDLKETLEHIEKHRITWFFAVPPIVAMLAEDPLVDEYDTSSLKILFCGAAPLDAELSIKASERLGCLVLQGYGLTEASPVTHTAPEDAPKPASCGLALPNTETRIVDSDGNDVEPGKPGEIWIRGPQVMKGYLNNAEASAEAITSDGWLRTGDLGYVDCDGHLYIVDRIKEIIKYKGFQVAPAELEKHLEQHGDIDAAAVVGVDDKEAGQVPRAFVALRPGAELSDTEIMAYIKERVASYKQIRSVKFVDSIPRSLAGKVLRRQLLEQYP